MHSPVRRQYQALADTYDRRWAYYIYATITAALDAIECKGTERALDVACGTGELARLLLAQWPGLTIWGLDLSDTMLRRARTKLCGNLHAALACGTATGLPFPDGAFDLVVCTNAFHYFPQPYRALAEMRRVLRPGGQLVIVDWCHDYWTCKVCHWYLRLTDPGYFRMYTSQACRLHLTAGGFEVRGARRFKISPLWGLMSFVARKAREAPSI